MVALVFDPDGDRTCYAVEVSGRAAGIDVVTALLCCGGGVDAVSPIIVRATAKPAPTDALCTLFIWIPTFAFVEFAPQLDELATTAHGVSDDVAGTLPRAARPPSIVFN